MTQAELKSFRMIKIRKIHRLRKRVFQLALGGTGSIALATIVTNLLRLVSSVTLTRLLDARAFGVVGVLMSVAIVFQLISDIGVEPFVIRHRKGGDGAFLDEIWTLRLIRSTILACCMCVASMPISVFLEKPEFAPVLALWSLTFIIDGLSSMTFATAIRQNMLWRLAAVELGASIFQLVLAIILAILFRSYWALVFAMLGAATFKVILSYTLFPNSGRRWSLSRERAQEMWTFSRFIAPSSLISLLILQTDKLVLARLMPLADYGLYAVAVSLAAAGPTLARQYGRRILYPVYAETARSAPEKLREVLYAKRRLANFVYMASTGAFSGAAVLVIKILYDSRFQLVAPYLQLLSISGVVTLANFSAQEALIVAENLRATFQANIVRALWIGIGVYLALITHKTILLVAAFGSVEIAAMIYYWFAMQKMRILNIRQEIVGLFIASAFACSSFIFSEVVIKFL